MATYIKIKSAVWVFMFCSPVLWTSVRWWWRETGMTVRSLAPPLWNTMTWRLQRLWYAWAPGSRGRTSLAHWRPPQTPVILSHCRLKSLSPLKTSSPFLHWWVTLKNMNRKKYIYRKRGLNSFDFIRIFKTHTLHISVSQQCMTPPHSPSFAETSGTAVLSTSVAGLGLKPVLSQSRLCSPLTNRATCHVSLHPPTTVMLNVSSDQPLIRRATSVIRHTADSSVDHDIPTPATGKEMQYSTENPLQHTEPGSNPTANQQNCKTPHDLAGTERTAPSPDSTVPVIPTSLSVSQAIPQSPISSPPVLCQVFPVNGQTGIISAFVQTPVQMQASGSKPILPQASPLSQSLLVGSPVAQGTVMFVVPQSQVSQASSCQQSIVTLGNTKLLPLAPAPVFMPTGQSGGVTQSDFSRRRNYVCNFQGCKKTYFKSSHLKAHLRTHTGLYSLFSGYDVIQYLQ